MSVSRSPFLRASAVSLCWAESGPRVPSMRTAGIESEFAVLWGNGSEPQPTSRTAQRVATKYRTLCGFPTGVWIPDEPDPAQPHKRSWQHPAADLDLFQLAPEAAGMFDDNEKARSGKRGNNFFSIYFSLFSRYKRTTSRRCLSCPASTKQCKARQRSTKQYKAVQGAASPGINTKASNDYAR